ncbi:AAA family ATPase [Rhodoferax sp.]|uniref:AAA family ATPase n=1 Tax=Rhodoferax sp. TaxID=50421 RepID=UPI0027582C76|nr:ATP-binding protein [Rhodoferax sp.]
MKRNRLVDQLNDRPSTPAAEYWRDQPGNQARLAYRDRLACWLLRILGSAGVMPTSADTSPPHHAAFAELLSVPELADPTASPLAVSQAVSAALQRLADPARPACTPTVLDCGMLRTLNWLAHAAGLDALERDILEFALALQTFGPLRSAVEIWGDIGYGDVISALALVLQAPSEGVAKALQTHGRLLGSGLLRFMVYQHSALGELLYLPRKLAQRLPFHEDAPALILSHLAVPLRTTELTLADFAHMTLDTRLAQCWLGGALRSASQGQPAGHLLVSGAPGLGKTEWVRALLQSTPTSLPGSVDHPAQTAVQALELVVLHDDGSALSGEDRLSHLRLALSLLKHTPGGVLVFDEADDVFRSQSEFGPGASDDDAVSMANRRASLNRLLEEARIPVIWVMNHPQVLDPAVLRRFDAVVSFDAMPRSVRLSMLRSRLSGVCREAQCDQWADIAELTPALIDRMAVLHARSKDAGAALDAELCQHWLQRRLPGKASRYLRPGQRSQASWTPELVNASHDLVALAQGIALSGSARILLHGAPGTGKTAYAHELARRLDRPLLEKRASDLLAAWVGETEQRIAKAFSTAVQDGAVLFIDEADSLLLGRDHAVRSWEVSQVNELLEQLGEFEGVVVLATNRLAALDGAVLRRLDAKVEFMSLTAQQALIGFVRLCAELGLARDGLAEQALVQLSELTPGDFACLARRHRFAPFDSARALATACKAELALRSGGKSPMGFHPRPAHRPLALAPDLTNPPHPGAHT